jgi:hypothetical protein
LQSASEYFDVEKILDVRVNSATNLPEYLVKWEGFSAKYNSWRTENDLAQCALLPLFKQERIAVLRAMESSEAAMET